MMFNDISMNQCLIVKMSVEDDDFVSNRSKYHKLKTCSHQTKTKEETKIVFNVCLLNLSFSIVV